MISEDEYLERVVAGIHAVSSNNADVKWNEKINRRQFDVVVRFALGTLNYLVLVEVKNRSRRASASDVEAFVTKARDQLANKSVFVTSAGFQEGAITVGKRHGVDLFQISLSDDIGMSPAATLITRKNPHYRGDRTPRLDVSERTLTQVIEDARLHFVDGRSFDMPSESSQMSYYAYRTMLFDGRNLGELMQSVPFRTVADGESRKETVTLAPPANVTPPDDYYFPAGVLASIDITLVGRMALIISGNIGVEPTALSSPVAYKNVVTGIETQFAPGQLPLNTEPLLEGGFYMQLHPLRYFHCASIQGDDVTWDLIESFQLNEQIGGTFVQSAEYGSCYIPVANRKTSQRLERRLADYRSLQRKPAAR